MKIEKCIKEGFAVIGMEGSTFDGADFIKKLWDKANFRFGEVESIAKKDENGKLAGIWGAMSDMTLSFMPWEDDFSKGLYLAGVECEKDAEAPDGWTKWVIPGYEYIRAEGGGNTFWETLKYMEENGISLAGAAHDFTCPETGKNYMYFPVKKLNEE